MLARLTGHKPLIDGCAEDINAIGAAARRRSLSGGAAAIDRRQSGTPRVFAGWIGGPD
jgi:hypothetical protein